MSDEGERTKRLQRAWTLTALEPSGPWAEKRRLAAAMREVIDRLVTSDAPEEELARAADRLERYAARLASHPRRTRTIGFPETATAGRVSSAGAQFDYSPLIGLSNPLSPPMRLRVEGERAIGEVVFGAAYEGPPGHVHGGVVASAFDELLGFTQSMTGEPGMTGTLTIRYRRPTPLHTELRLTGEVLRVEARKIFNRGTLHAGTALCAEAEGVFVRVGAERFRDLAARRVRHRED